jgi:HEAT repeat protein
MLRRILVVLIIFCLLTIQLQGWPWDSPDVKAGKYLGKIEVIAKNAETIDQIGWNPRANVLMKKLQKFGSPAVQPTINNMLNKDKDWKFRFVCIDLLHGIKDLDTEDGYKIVQSYVILLWDKNEDVILRERLAHALGRIGVTSEAHRKTEEKAGIELPQHLWPKLLSSEIREDIVDTLIALSLDDGTPISLRYSSIGALCTYYDFANIIIDSLTNLLNSSNDKLCAGIVNTLGGIGMMAERERIGDILVGVLRTKAKDNLASEQAIFWIKGLKIRAAIPFLLESLENGKYCSKAESAEILGILKVKEAVPLLIDASEQTKDALLAYESIMALGKIGDERALETLLKIVKSEWSTADDAARALGLIGSKRAVPVLIDVLENENTRMSVKKAASVSLMMLGAIESIPLIENAINEGKKVDPRTWGELEKMLNKFTRGEMIEGGEE